MLKLLRTLILLVLSFNLSAETNPNIHQADNLEQAIEKLQANDIELGKSIATLNKQVSASIDSNNRVVNESRVLIQEVKKLMKVQEAQRKDILALMDKAKKIPEQEVDLSLSLTPDWWGISFNLASALILGLTSLFVTLYVTFKVLTRTLSNETEKQRLALVNETEKQGRALESNLKQTEAQNKGLIKVQLDIAKRQDERLSKDLIAKTSITKSELEAQTKISQAELEAQVKLNYEQSKEAHSLKIDEFRQAWINTFREDISVLCKSFVTLKNFHSVEEGFFVAWDILKRAERRQRAVYDELVELANQEADLISKVRAKLRINDDEDYREALKHSSDMKENFAQYKNEFREFNNLHATIIEQKTKIMLMFSPNGTPDEKNVVKKLDRIHNFLSLGERTFMPKGDKDSIDVALTELQPLVQDMLKIEWNRVKRVKPF